MVDRKTTIFRSVAGTCALCGIFFGKYHQVANVFVVTKGDDSINATWSYGELPDIVLF